jgi:hypothetical protein
MHSYYNTKKSFSSIKTEKLTTFAIKKLTNLITHQKISKNSNINITSKLGWVYMPTMLSNFFLYHKSFPSGKN